MTQKKMTAADFQKKHGRKTELPDTTTASQFKEIAAQARRSFLNAEDIQEHFPGVKSETELRFMQDLPPAERRRFAFDLAFPDYKVAFEYEGIIPGRPGDKSRHTSITGYSRDCEKYNLAQILGWIVLRGTVITCDKRNPVILDHIRKALTTRGHKFE